MRVLITGATGLVGRAVTSFFKAWGYEVFRLVRQPDKVGPDAFYWDPDQGDIKPMELEGFHAVIHLAGENIAGRWTEDKKKKILDSRVKSTRLLSETLASLKEPPKVFISASAIGYYGSSGKSPVDEKGPCGKDFLSGVCREWEEATRAAKEKGIRVINLRLGVVLSDQGGALKSMLIPFRFCLGGVVGSGEQVMSWVSLEDVPRAIHYLIADTNLEGAVNLTAPFPVTNREFTSALGATVHRPTFLPMPASLARFVFGEMADALMLSSSHIVPARLSQAGFSFLHPRLNEALEHILKTPS